MTVSPVIPATPSWPVPRPLTRWGVSPDGDLVYRTLVQFGPATEAKLTQTLGLSRRRVRNALDDLGHLGAVRVDPARASRPAPESRTAGVLGLAEGGRAWRAAHPDGLERRLQARHADQLRNQYLLRQRLLGLRELGIPDLSPATADRWRVLFGLSNVRGRLAELMAETRGEFLSASPEPAFSAAAVAASRPLEHLLVDNGVKIMALGVPAEPGDASTAHGEEMLLRGMQYRELDEIPTKLMLFGRAKALIPLVPGKGGQGALELTDPETVQGLVEHFLRWWATGRTIGRGDATAALSPREAAIVRLLAAGHTDASASGELGLSMRTIAYAIRQLMDRYHVENRFQLGLTLGSRGVAPETAAGLCNVAADPATGS